MPKHSHKRRKRQPPSYDGGPAAANQQKAPATAILTRPNERYELKVNLVTDNTLLADFEPDLLVDIEW